MPAGRPQRAAGSTCGSRRVVGVVGLRRATAVVLLAALTTAVGGESGAWLAELGAGGFAMCAGIGCLRAARHTQAGVRVGWTVLAVASWSWGTAHLVALLATDTFGPPGSGRSQTDVAGLVFPIAALVAVCLLAPRSPGRPLPRRVIDALTVGGALTLTAWVLVVDSAPAAAVGPLPALLDWPANPLADVVLLAVMVLTVARDRRLPRRWALLGGVMLAMAVADGAVAMLRDVASPAALNLVRWTWWAGFCLFATAGAAARPTDGVLEAADQEAPARRGRPGVLPYLPLAVAAGAVAAEYSCDNGLDAVGTVLAVMLGVLVLVREYGMVRDEHRMARAVAAREVELHHMAFHDPLTGLANRALFLDRLRHALDLTVRVPRAVSVVFVDLDGFKTVNDTLGHAAGDQLLVGVARRLRGAVRTTDTLARLGGDEFAVLVEQGADAAVLARTLLATLHRPFLLAGREVGVSASIGVATADPRQGAEQASALLHRADAAMYAVKSSGKGGVLVHSPAVPDRPRRAVPPQQRELAAAIERGALGTLFRPVVDSGHGRVAALEALPRWSEAAAGPPPPGLRITSCPPLTAAVLEQACRQLAAWSCGLGHHRLRMTVAVGVAELDDADLPVRVDRVLARHRLAPAQLTLEIEDSELPERSAAALDALHRLHHLGVRLGLGGLGSGYATLAWLSGAPLDTVKIDSALVADIDHDSSRRRLLHGVLALTRHLGMRSVADGVERSGQLVELRQLGCDYVAGHLVAGPATVAELTPVLLAGQPLLPRGLIPAAAHADPS